MSESPVKGTELQNEASMGSQLHPARRSIPLTTRLSIEIPKPKDWQAFQRNCVLLFRAELNDPHAQEYGRSGQKQGGIDILARRDGRDDHFVGVQCRLINKSLKEAKILSDARAALRLKAGLKELIFVTTAPDDTSSSDAAIEVSRKLKVESHDLTVFVYGWGQLQTLISQHEVAYNAFHPSAVASSLPQVPGLAPGGADLAALIAAQVVDQLRGAGMAVALRVHEETAANSEEDSGLHARIDTFRDLFKDHCAPLLAQKGLLGLLEKEDLRAKPWARFRIEINLGSIAMELGREAEAAARFEVAYGIRPDDPHAIAHLALARTIQGRFEEAMTAAQAALDGQPRADHAVSYLLQAAARSDWQGEPESLIPTDLVATAHADIGLADFLRRREVPGWAGRCLEIARRHASTPEFRSIGAIAVLSLAIDSAAINTGGHGPLTMAELNTAADDMKALVERYFEIGFADANDLFAHLSNAAILLRLCGRHADSEALLLRGISRVADEPQLRRLLALAQSAQDRDADAIVTLAGDTDPENQIFRSELQASNGDIASALPSVLSIDHTGLPERLRRLRLRLIGEMSLRLGDDANLAAAIAGLRALDPLDIAASVMEIRSDRKTTEDEDIVHERMRKLAKSVPADLDMASRYFLADELRSQDLPDEASRLLDGHVDLTWTSPAVFLYLQSLAEARRDDAFRAALAKAAPEVRNDPRTLWTVSAHAWNLGDLKTSMAAAEALLALEPDKPRARLLKIEILIREDRSGELFTELEKPLEALAWRRPDDQFRLASLLGKFGFTERAADLAYRLFLQHRDLSRAWMTLSMLVLDEGRGDKSMPRLLNATEVGPNSAVDLDYDDGSKAFFVVELDPALLRLDPESWELEHALVRAVRGRRVGERFAGPDGREGIVRQIRHKYVARLHYVMQHYETRFPEISGFRQITVDFERAGGLDGLTAQLKARHDWIQEEQNQYLNGPMPISVFAHRVGMDSIEVGAGLASLGARLKVAAGSLQEREGAARAVRSNQRRGCVLDLLAFWTAWRLEALDEIRATCGPIHLPRSILDRLRARRERLWYNSRDGLKTAGYDNGKIVLQEVSAEVVAAQRDEVDRAIAWAEANTTISPIVAGEDLHGLLRELLQMGHSDIFDSLVLARQTKMLHVTDDLPTRDIDRLTGGGASAWLHAVFGVALEQKHFSMDRYIKFSVDLIDAGHSYLGVSDSMLVHAARLDANTGKGLGALFRRLSTLIGGRDADPASHIDVVVGCLRAFWTGGTAAGFREPVTSHLLRQLVRERTADFPRILQIVLVRIRDVPALRNYLYEWLRGHFLAHAVLPRSQ
ncbi:MAG: hypothetical protein WAS21_33085 [Geminicoccaceae bacterium]